MILTPHYTLEDALRSRQGEAAGIVNSPDKDQLDNIKYSASCAENFWWLIDHFTSFFRCEELNELVDGHPDSYHVRGLAFDFRPMDVYSKFDIVYILKGLSYNFVRKVIVYEETRHVHISFWPPGSSGKAKFLLKLAEGGYRSL